MRGRWLGEAEADEVGLFRLHSVVHLISRLRRQLPLIGEATGSAEIPTPSPEGRWLRSEAEQTDEGRGAVAVTASGWKKSVKMIRNSM